MSEEDICTSSTSQDEKMNIDSMIDDSSVIISDSGKKKKILRYFVTIFHLGMLFEPNIRQMHLTRAFKIGIFRTKSESLKEKCRVRIKF
jgi:hypothetical protein